MKKIPNTEDWKPNKSKSDNLHKIMFDKCQAYENTIIARCSEESKYNINNFDSGTSVEQIIRNCIEEILPKRYKITKGYVTDRDGKTSGEHDIILFNDQWFPYLTGNNPKQIRYFFPIEGIYAIGEVKQRLTIEAMDEGLKKLVMAQRLKRPRIGINRFTENRKEGDEELGISNPLFTFLIGITRDKKISIDDYFQRFVEINKSLHRQEMIRTLCIFNDFSISWAVFNEETQNIDVARFFSEDEDKPIIPALRQKSKGNISILHDLMMYLGSHLNGSILGSDDMYIAYGNKNFEFQLPPIEEYVIHNY